MMAQRRQAIGVVAADKGGNREEKGAIVFITVGEEALATGFNGLSTTG